MTTNHKDQGLSAMLSTVRERPDDFSAWDELEALAADAQAPEPVAELYAQVLSRELSPATSKRLGERATRFCEEWFADETPHMQAVLLRVFELDASDEPIFDRLSMGLTAAGNWTLLLQVYEKAVDATDSLERQVQLLDDAVRVAKDLAQDADRAIAFLERLVPLRPADQALRSSLERLLERGERWRELIALWDSGTQGMAAADAARVKVQIATCWLDKLKNAPAALDVLRKLLEASPDHEDGLTLTERILSSDDAASGTRRDALALLRKTFERSGRPLDAARVIRLGLAFTGNQDREKLLRDAATISLQQGLGAEALNDLGELFARRPDDDDLAEEIAGLAKQLDAQQRHVEILEQAAERAQTKRRAGALRLRAATLAHDPVGDVDRALALCERVFVDDTEPDLALDAGRALDALLEANNRSEARVPVLERLAALEGDKDRKREVLGALAKLAGGRGDSGRAVATWRKRLEQDESDSEALDGLITLYEARRDYPALVDVLRRRVRTVEPQAAAKDLGRIAEVYAEQLSDLESALGAWDELYRAAPEQIEELKVSELLDRAAQRESVRGARVLAAMGDTYRVLLGDASRALAHYTRALSADPQHGVARAGLTALLAFDAVRAPAADALASAYVSSDEVEGLLSLLPHRLFGAPDASSRASLLRQAAHLEEARRGRPAEAFEHLRAALDEEPVNASGDADLWRLAEQADAWQPLVDSLRSASTKLDAASPRFAQLKAREAELCERRLQVPEQALEAYASALRALPGDTGLASSVCRIAAQLGRYGEAFDVVVAAAHRGDRVPDELLDLLEAQLGEPEAYRGLCGAAEQSLESQRLNPPVKRELLTRVAMWLERRAGDLDAAEAVLTKASKLAGPHVETLRRLVTLQRRAPGRALFASLMAVAELSDQDLDSLIEARALASEVLGDAALERGVLELLVTRAGAALRRAQKPSDSAALEALVGPGTKRLADIYAAAGEAALEVGILRETAQLPIESELARAFAERAAKVAIEKLHDAELGVALYQRALEQAPSSTEILAALAAEYDKLGRLEELLVLRRRELALTTQVARRLELRLDIARAMAEIETRGGRLGALHDNLRDAPGHEASLVALERALRERGALLDVYDLFAAQAAQLEALGDVGRAAELWAAAARLADVELKREDKTLAAYQRVAELRATDEALDTLARIRLGRNEPGLAVPWLERRLGRLAEDARVGIRLQLAHAYQLANEPARAVECLSAGVEEAPASFELRDLLASSYRATGRLEDLANLLSENALRVPDRSLVLGYAREAASLYCTTLGQPERAVAVLSRAVEVDSEDRGLKCLYADALSAAGRLDEAKAVLDAMVQAYGRRRSPERAEVHLRLSRVAQAEGNIEEALTQLDTASSMDRAHTGILRALGELAQQAGQHERAERAYRALLMAVKKPAAGGTPEIGLAEVYYQLHRVASALGQTEKAAELLDSAVQTAVQNEGETARLKLLLVERGEPQLLLRVLEMRLAQVQDPVTEALVLSDLADVLETALDRKDEALEARLKALACAPERDALHQGALRVAESLGKVRRYVDAVRMLVERARRKDDIALVSDLALRAASTLEHGLGDLDGAENLYKLVEANGPGYVEAQFARARLAGKLGHADEERAVLARIVDLPDDPAYATSKRNARYRLVELLVQAPATRDEGLEGLMRLIAQDPDYVRASAILQAACEVDPSDGRALEMLEQIARRSDEPRVLLDYLERHARGSDASLGLIREGAELALRIKEHARAEALLRRAIQIAEHGDGLVEALWAATALGRLRRDQGDIKGALDWLERAMTASDPIEAFDLGLELATLAAERGKDPARAARIYETLRERDPADRRVWTPLLALYKKAGDLDRTLGVVRSTLEALFDPAERNALRLETSRLLFQAGREDDGAALLHDVLGEEPDHEEAALTLADLYERRGQNEALADLLTRKLESARERRSPSLIPLSLRMGGLLEPTRPEHAVAIYREGLALIPDSVELMRVTISLLDPDDNGAERAALLERYLTREGKDDPRALDYALWLLDYQVRSGDESAFEQALAIAYRVAPGRDEIRTRLESWYRQREDYPNLVGMLEQEANRLDDQVRSVALLTEAADIRLYKLGQPSEAAALLRKAREFAPGDFELLKRAVLASAASGELGPALAEVDRSLDDGNRSRRERVELLLLRADVAASAGMHDDAVSALDAAYADGGKAVLPHLIRGIDGARVAARERGNGERERELTLRLVPLLGRGGDKEQPIQLLLAWIERAPQDTEALRALLELLNGAERWSEIIGVAEALIQIDAAEQLGAIGERLVAAARAVGQLERARPGLELGLARDPRQPRLAQLLAELYQDLGEKRALAELMLRYLAPPESPEKRFEQLRRIGQLLLDAGDMDAALQALTQAFEIKSDDVPTVLFIADAHIGARRFQEAQDLLEKAMNAYRQRRSPELAQLRQRMAKLAAAVGDAQARLEWLNAAIEADMNNGEIASELAVVAQNMGDLETALKALRAITMLKTDAPMSRAEAFYRQAVIVAQKGEPRRAVLWAKKAKAEDANFPGVDKLLAELGEA